MKTQTPSVGKYYHINLYFLVSSSVAYVAPELLIQTGHNRMVDWYLLGVFLYELLVGLPPFFNSDRNILFQNIRMGILRYPSWEISLEAKDLIEKVEVFKGFYLIYRSC